MKLMEGQVVNSLYVTRYVMDLHYEKWDTQGRNESDIPDRINKYQNFIVKKIDISKISRPNSEIDDDKIEEYSLMNFDTMPIIILEEYNNKYYIIDGCHRYYIAIKKNSNYMFAFIPFNN